MEKMHDFKAFKLNIKVSEAAVLRFITVVLYFCAIMSFAYLFTMS